MCGGSVGAPFLVLYEETRRGKHLEFSTHFCLSLLSPVTFVALSSSFPRIGDYVHGCLREQASETPSAKILHREVGDKVFGSISVRQLTVVRVLPC
jgi:hypothetical protein